MLIDKIRAKVKSSASSLPIPATNSDISELEEKLGLTIPPILKQCLLTIANGGFGPSNGLIGTKGGYEGDFGNLEETYRTFHEDPTVSTQLLPFCYWGGILFSCVDCTTGKIWVLSGNIPMKVFETSMSIDEFFEEWLVDSPALLQSLAKERQVRVIRCPMTGKDIEISVSLH